ncbi:MAG TPA: HAD-IIIA family hydrolase, partial [Acetobacteraceae bacterium]
AVASLRSGAVARSRLSHPQKAVFVDRDGTINPLSGYLTRAEEFALIPDAAEAVRRLNAAEYRVVVTTNQPVIARGEASVAELRRIHGRMQTLLGQGGGFVDRVYYCPHHPDGGFPGEVVALKHACTCRKPEPGMVDQAAADLNIDLAESWVVGDSTADMAMARRRGIRSILVRTGEAGRDGKHDAPPDFVAADLAEAASLILERWPVLVAGAGPVAVRCGPGDMVLIGGLARSGKSSFASALAYLLRARGLGATIVPLDHWIRSQADRAPGLLGRYDLPAAEQAVAALAAGGPATCPDYDAMQRTSQPDRHVLAAEPGGVMIVEGCPALLSQPLKARSTHRIFVACTEEVRMRRFVADYQRRGVAPEVIQALYQAREDDEHALVRDSAGAADQRIML